MKQESSTFSFAPGDVVTSLSLSNGSTAATAATGNVTNYLNVASGSTLSLGANLNLLPIGGLTSSLYLSGGTIEANGHAIAATDVTLSGLFAINNRGPITATNLGVFSAPGQAPFSVAPSDAITNLSLYGTGVNFPTRTAVQGLNALGTDITLPPTLTTQNLTLSFASYSPPPISKVTTSAVGNVTGSVSVYPGGTLVLGVTLVCRCPHVRSTWKSRRQRPCSFSRTIYMGWYGDPFAFANPGTINATNLLVNLGNNSGTTNFNLPAGSTVTNFTVANTNAVLAAGAHVQNLTVEPWPPASVTTMAADNVTASVLVDTGCTLTLGADLVLSNSLTVRGATLNANGHGLSSPVVNISNLGGPAMVQNAGVVNAGRWVQSRGSQVRLHSGDCARAQCS